MLSISGFCFSLAVLVVPFLSKYLIDEALNINNGKVNSYDRLIMLIIFISIFTLVSIILKVIDLFLYSRFYIKLEAELKNKLYKSMSYKNVIELINFKLGDIEMLYEQDIKNILRAKLQIIPQIIKQISRALISLILLFILDETKYKIMIISLLLIGVIGLISAKIYSKIIKPYHKKVLEADSITSNFFIDSFNHHKQIVSYSAYDRSIEYYINLNNDSVNKKKKRNFIIYSANSFVYAFITIVYSLCIIFGAYLISKGIYTYGSLIAIVQLINNIEAPFLSLSSLISNYNLGNASIERINELLKLDEVKNNNRINDFDLIKFDHVSFSYDGINMIINDLNLEIKKGDIVKFAGPSGAGKTTILLLLLGYLKPSSGLIKYYYNEKEYDILDLDIFAYLSQENILFSASILENIYILTGVRDINKIYEALKDANIYDEIMKLKDGINTIVNNNSGLSVGQIQRLLIAIMILHDRPILLLDEFSSNLDINNEDIIINNLLKYNKTIIYISHRNNKILDEKVVNINRDFWGD